MEDYNGYETVKERLILAGISELQKHSVEDLSLRKISALCNVSCAAPYKHFQDKDDFVAEIVKYVNLQWTKLREQIMSIFKDDEKMQVLEVCTSYIKFCIANPNFSNIMVMTKGDKGDIRPHEDFYFSADDNIIRKYCKKTYADKDEAEMKTLKIHSIVYGTAYMIGEGIVKNTEDTIENVRKALLEELK